MAPDRPDASGALETGVGLASSKNFEHLCHAYSLKEADTSSIKDQQHEAVVQIRPAAAPNSIQAPPRPGDDELTSLAWLHRQNILPGLQEVGQRNPERQNSSKEIYQEAGLVSSNNNNEEADVDMTEPELSDENTNSSSSIEDNCSNGEIGERSNGFIINFEQNYASPNEHSVIKYHQSSPDKSPNSSHMSNDKIAHINNNNNNHHNNNNNNLSPNHNPPSTGRNKHPNHIPYDPHLHRNSKPPYSFSCLIFMAIEDSPLKALPVKQVYAWILEHFPYFRNAPTGWKNSVRHNLSLNKCFRKVEKSPSLGKGSLWMVDAQYRPNLIQALARAPCPMTGPGGGPQVVNNVSPEKSGFRKLTNARLPDPVLFPYLSKRLASSNICDAMDNEFDSDVDAAAAAMLSFKHGPIILNHHHKEKSMADKFHNNERKRKSQELEKLVPVITRSSTEDHTYSLVTSVRLESNNNSTTDYDEQRKIAEGADALLNLAGINTFMEPPIREQFNPAPKQKSFSVNIPDKRRKRWRDWNENGRYMKQQVRG